MEKRLVPSIYEMSHTVFDTQERGAACVPAVLATGVEGTDPAGSESFG